MENITKICGKCGVLKPVTEFHKNKSTTDGLHHQCKTCRTEYYAEHREEIIARKRAYRFEHREEIRARNKAYRSKHREELRASHKDYDAEHREEKRAYDKAYKKDHPERIKARDALNNAIASGKLTRPDHCEICGTPCKPHAHHWRYEPEHRLSVVWLCPLCHRGIHVALTEQGVVL